MAQKLAILTSGGDAPGMNSAIRAIVLASLNKGYQCIGFYHGYNGLIEQQFTELDEHSVNNITQHGGTILKSARCPAMLNTAGISQAANTLRKLHISALIVIGGDGSFHGLDALSEHWQGTLIGLPGTIDNDLSGCDHTIGFSTAVNTATRAIDKIRDTANAFERVFITEVMGRHSGHIAFNTGIATGAESILSFENCDVNKQQHIVTQLLAAITEQRNKHASFVIVLAENLWPGGASSLQAQLNQHTDFNCAVCILGHIQRGGAPSSEDRMLATTLGVAAVEYIDELLLAASSSPAPIMIGQINGQLTQTLISDVLKCNKPVASKWVQQYQHYLSAKSTISN
ncbi:6-phosphofructokinase [Pseudoalteromonas mariniglutinosa]|uniref:6-phosphofructokinase n=1 Tax=Pseudoalteromonas mariniglutinosa TaxID=206042 RepID=UPI00384DE83A